jgi:hypothetical protein
VGGAKRFGEGPLCGTSADALTWEPSAADVQRLPLRGTAQLVGQGWIVYAFGRHDAANAQGGKRKCALAPLRSSSRLETRPVFPTPLDTLLSCVAHA